MQARLFSYLDTQLTRLGGPELHPAADQPPALPGQRHAARRHAPDRRSTQGVAPYLPNSIDGGAPLRCAMRTRAATCTSPRQVEGPKVRENPVSFDDHFSQATLFWRSMSDGRAGAHRRGVHLRARQVLRAADPRADARRPGATSTPTCARRSPRGSACRRRRATPAEDVAPSPALSQIVDRTRADRGPRDRRVRRRRRRPRRHRQAARGARGAEGAVLRVIAPHGGDAQQGPHRADRRAHVADHPVDRVRRRRGRARAAPTSTTSSCRSCCRRPSGTARRSAPGATAPVLTAAGIDTTAPGVLVGESTAKPFTSELLDAVGMHRVWERAELVMTSS